MPNFTTGPATLPDVGTLSYNGCEFSPLFESTVSSSVVKDNSGRTTKFIEYTITVDGYVTLPVGDSTIEPTTAVLRKLLTATGGVLVYKGRATNITVNHTVRDVAWGPIPELLDFQSLGGSRSAKVKWQVKTRLTEIAAATSTGRFGPVLQFNEETSVSYDEAGYSTLTISGTLEIPLTRDTQTTRTLTHTVDNFRDLFLNTIAEGIDLKLFRVTRREMTISRDKRTMEWSFAAEELPYMGMPANVTIARGNFSFRPVKTGAGLANWLCTLRATYTVRKDKPRRLAWLAFLALLRERMAASIAGNIPPPNNPGIGGLFVPIPLVQAATGISLIRSILKNQNGRVNNAHKAILIDFSGDEGLYLDSKTMSFSATWRLVTTFSHILLASGLWRKVPGDGGNFWEISMRNVSGANSWLINRLDPARSAIIDFGSQ